MLNSKIKHSIRYFDNPTNRYHSGYHWCVNMSIVSTVSVTTSLYLILSEYTDYVRYLIAAAIVLLYSFIWKTIFFPKGKHNV